ncbi:MAG TPA: right-handed parallel beta-helix repeat-containing protein [Geminicoccaceae bacterium]|nr:right-handed parallel beta-helix repeat-containing protein [Geminicoccaceae bacterium]
MTDTTLEASDPIVVDGCKEDVKAGLGLVQPSVTLDCAGLTIDGPGFDSECAHDETCGAGILISASRVTVQRCSVQEFGFAIGTTNGVSRLLIQANSLHDNDKGIRFGEPVTDSRVIGNTASNNAEFGIQFKNGPVGNLILGNTTIDNGRVGIQINQQAERNRIILNYVRGNGSRGGIRVDARSSDNLIEDNFVQGGVFGIGFNAETTQNVVRRNVITGTTLAGIWFDGPGGPNTVRDNLITANQGEGIRIEAQADRHRVRRNVVLDNAAGGIEVCGADNEIDRNRAFNNAAFDLCIVGGNRVGDNEGGVVNLACPVPPQCVNLDPKSGDPGNAE